MSKPPPAEAVPAARPALLARLRAAIGGLSGWMRRNKLKAALAGLAAVAVIGLSAGLALMFLPQNDIPQTDLMTQALERLDAGDDRQARQIAAQLRAEQHLSYTELGGPMFVLGVVTAREAQTHFNDEQRQTLYLVASRYLEEAKSRGFPPGREQAGLLLLGRSLHHCGRYAQSLPILRESIAADPQPAAELHRLLAEGNLQLAPPKLDEALRHIRLYRAAPNLPAHDLETGLLLESRILLAQRKLDDAEAVLAKIPEKSALHPEGVVLQTRLTIERVKAAQVEGGELSADHRAALATAIGAARQISGSEGPARSALAHAQLLMGQCYELLGDRRAAIAQYDRTRRAFFGRPEALAATLFQADLIRQEGKAAEAVALYLRAIQLAGPRDTFQNPWMTLDELQLRLQSAGDDLIARDEFTLALELAGGATPLLPEVFSVQQIIVTHRAWAQQLAAEAAALPPLEMEVAQAEARRHFREAGAAAERLAALRIATRGYLDDLSNAARLFLQGQGYRQAVRVYRVFLRQDPQQGEPEALVGLGAALLALNDIDAARAALARCREAFPKHPATYRARILESAALEEQSQLAQAKELLLDNLYRHALTPQSSDWRDSLFALGLLLYREASEYETKSRLAGVDQVDPEAKREGLKLLEQSHATFQEAIRNLAEAVQRYPEAAGAIEARYRIAESHRHSAKWPRKKLGVVTIETSRVSLNRQVQQDLLSALDEYTRLIAELSDQQQSGSRSPEELAILRNSYFARPDALFDLGRYEEAIGAYSAATNRYQQTPEALEAYVQIASCYRRMNRPNEARGTLEQARVVLQRIRPDADFTRTTRLDRQQWTDLLAWLRTL